MSAIFDISPEKEASKLQCLRRQLFVVPPEVTQREVDLRGRTAVVTGSNGGIGLECARQLLDLGLSKLILAVRDESKGQLAVANLAEGRSLEPGQIEAWKLDLSSYESIVAFAERASRLETLEIAVLNAAVYRVSLHINPSTGHEEDVQTNYLSNVLLAILLLRIFHTNRTPGRITLVSSDTAAWSKFKQRNADRILPALDSRSGKWDMQERYGTSKLLGQLFLTELAKRVPPSVTVVNAANPGLCHGSGLVRDTNGTFLGYFLSLGVRFLGRSAAVGARTLVDAAVRKGPESHGHYVEDGKLRPMAPLVYTPAGEVIAKRLWDETMEELSFAGIKEILDDIGSMR